MPFFTYRQNQAEPASERFPQCHHYNGHFKYTDTVAKYVVIEAEDATQANKRAESFGLYWRGVAAGRDCECCGDRWHPCRDDDGAPYPTVDGNPIYHPCLDDVFVHYLDGTTAKHLQYSTRPIIVRY